ncbi:hypothetical protein FQN57_003208 [Myotisia sp. PD_48]|nr:hypothetical protein FQN57_003208 [Myotisia sp. PD_48]
MPKLPLNVLVAIRAHWTKQESPVKKSIKALYEELGYKLIVEPEWQLLFNELHSYYSKDNFVQVVAGCVQQCVDSLIDLLADSAHEQWIEKLLDYLESRQFLLFLEVSPSEVCSTFWDKERSGLVIELPRSNIRAPRFHMFAEQLLHCFEGKKTPVVHRSARSDDWAEVNVEVEADTGISTRPQSPRNEAEFLPEAASLLRPDKLFLDPPYYLLVSASRSLIEIQGSHSDSLRLIADYFKKWCRVSHQDTRKPPVIEIKLHQCAFGLGQMFDRLTLEVDLQAYGNTFQITSPMVLAFVEKILGYTLVSTRLTVWSYRRDVGFKPPRPS